MSEAIRWLLQTAELNVLDAFPSRHVALSLVFLALGWRLFPELALAAGARPAGERHAAPRPHRLGQPLQPARYGRAEGRASGMG